MARVGLPLSAQRAHEVGHILLVRDVPATVLRVAPRLRDGLAFETPHEPAPFDVGQVLDELERRPVRLQHACPQLVLPESLHLVDDDGAEEVEVAEEDLGAGRGRTGRLRGRAASRARVADVQEPVVRADQPATCRRRL